MHYRARSYDPRLGRFVQKEPIIGDRPFAHYLYGMNNPVTFIDPLGLQKSAQDEWDRVKSHLLGTLGNVQMLSSYREKALTALGKKIQELEYIKLSTTFINDLTKAIINAVPAETTLAKLAELTLSGLSTEALKGEGAKEVLEGLGGLGGGMLGKKIKEELGEKVGEKIGEGAVKLVEKLTETENFAVINQPARSFLGFQVAKGDPDISGHIVRWAVKDVERKNKEGKVIKDKEAFYQVKIRHKTTVLGEKMDSIITIEWRATEKAQKSKNMKKPDFTITVAKTSSPDVVEK